MLKVNINGVDFKNPVIAASGTFGFGAEYNNFYDVGVLGGISSKGLTLNEKAGNDGIRIYETAEGIMNSVGLQNPGVDAFIKNELPRMKSLGTNVIANLGGGTIEDYEKAIVKLNDTDIDIIELNISCPNVKAGGMAFGIKGEVAKDIVSKVRALTNKKLMVKLSPNAENICDMAVKCVEGGADSLSLVNTFKAMAVDINKRDIIFNNKFAGLSGPAIKPIALRMVHEVSRVVDVPVIGLGGIMTAEDAIEFMMVGASAIQIGTVNFLNPRAGIEIIKGMEEFCRREGIKNINEIVGCIK